jgi:hypothetical protein
MAFKRVLVVLLFLVGMGSSIFFWHYLTGGFKKEKIQATFLVENVKNSLQVPSYVLKKENKKEREKKEEIINKDEKETIVSREAMEGVNPEILKILDQEFRYLDQGCQTYVFQSQDQKYVLKLIRYSKYELPFWMQVIAFCDRGKAYKEKRQDFRNHKFLHSLKSYQIASREMKEETALIYSHLEKTSCFAKKLVVKDRLGRKFLLDLDQTGFILQRKVIPLRKQFLLYKENHELAKAQELTRSFLHTIREMAKKKIVNCDYNCVKNSGVFENRVVFLDMGSFFWAKDKGNPTLAEEMFVFTKHFRKWAIKEWPELLNFFEEELQKVSQEKGA